MINLAFDTEDKGGFTVTRGMSPWEAATQMFQPPAPGRGGGSMGLMAGNDGIAGNTF